MMTSTCIRLPLPPTSTRRAGTWLVGLLSAAVLLLAAPAWAQVTSSASPARQMQQARRQQQRRQSRMQLQRHMNRTASHAFKDQPDVQQQMYHARRVRQQQADARHSARISELGSPRLQQQQRRHQAHVRVHRQIRHTADRAFKSGHRTRAQPRAAQKVIQTLTDDSQNGHKPKTKEAEPAPASSSHAAR